MLQLFDIHSIAQARKRVQWTQQELAQKAGVSQSYIAKVENRTLEPTYTNAIRIVDVLQHAKHAQEPLARDMMHKGIIGITEKSSVQHALDMMRKHAISQLPVLQHNYVRGLLSESDILDQVGKNMKDIRVGEVMQGSPPSIPSSSSRDIVIALLHEHPLLIITEGKKLAGVITKADAVATFKKQPD
ncbi:MAG: CBS domain-containing protein [archaeon]